MRRSPRLFLGVIAAGLALSGVLTAEGAATNPGPSPGATGPSAQSSALYCTGLTDSHGQMRGRVTFINTTASPRQVVVHAVATGATAAVATAFFLGPYGRRVLAPTTLLVGDTYALAAQIDGGGVSAEQEVTRTGAPAACTNAGVTNWYGSGFDSSVGSRATLSVYNPTATAAVFNVTTFSPAGFLSPAPLQGLSVGPHAVLAINLGEEVVATQNFGAQVSVLRGSLVVMEDQVSGTTASMNSGTPVLASTGTFPLVTTANQAMAEVRIANPGPAPAHVILRVKLGRFHVAAQSATVAPYHSAFITITPNTAIPAAGEASLTMTADRPVAATLATGTRDGLKLSPLTPTVSRAILADVSGAGFAQATFTNASQRATRVTWKLIRHGAVTASGTSPLDKGVTLSWGQVLGGRSKLRGATLIATSPVADLVMNATLNTTPAGVTMAAPLDGG